MHINQIRVEDVNEPYEYEEPIDPNLSPLDDSYKAIPDYYVMDTYGVEPLF